MKLFVMVAAVALGVVVPAVAADDATGTWQCIEYTRGGESIPTMVEAGQLQLNADGTYVQILSKGIEDKGTYTISGNEIKLVQHERVKMQGTIENGIITLEFKPTFTRIVYQKTSA